MAYNVWFSLKANTTSDQMQSLKAFLGTSADGKIVEEFKRIEFKVGNHLLALPEEYISNEFCRKVRPFVEKITLVTEDFCYVDNKTDRIISFTMGDTVVSYDNHQVLVKGKNLMNMIKALNIFLRYKGQMEKYGADQAYLKMLEDKWMNSGVSIRNLSNECKILGKKNAEQLELILALSENLSANSVLLEKASIQISQLTTLLANGKKSFWSGVAHLLGLHKNEKLIFVRNIYGDEINFRGGKRSEWRCSKCNCFVYKDELHEVTKA